jgi:hypothetical protein
VTLSDRNRIGEAFALVVRHIRENGKRRARQRAILRERGIRKSETEEPAMARKPRDYDAELQALMERAKKVKTQKTVQLGELVQIVGADALPFEALAGALLAALEQSRKQPEAVARWTERGQAFFQQGGRRRKKPASGEAAGGTPGNGSSAAASERAA